jgi:Flp pilus assembly protein TadD
MKNTIFNVVFVTLAFFSVTVASCQNAKTLMESGKAAFEKEDYDRAIADYTKAIQLEPNNAEAYKLRGDAYAGKGDLDRAIADLSKVIQFDPDDAEAYYYSTYRHKRV